MARIGVDLDGVLYPFWEELQRCLTFSGYPKNLVNSVPQRWEFYEDWGMTAKGFNEWCNQLTDCGDLFLTGQPLFDVAPLHSLASDGHTIHIVTARNFGKRNKSHLDTVKWLGEHDVPYDTLTFSADKTIVPTDYFIEDSYVNYRLLKSTKKCIPVLLNQPWNQADNHLTRVDTLVEFANLVAKDSRYDFGE